MLHTSISVPLRVALQNVVHVCVQMDAVLGKELPGAEAAAICVEQRPLLPAAVPRVCFYILNKSCKSGSR